MTSIKLQYNVPQLHYAVDFIYKNNRFINRAPEAEGFERLRILTTIRDMMISSAKDNASVILEELKTGVSLSDRWVHSVGTFGCRISFTEDHYGGEICIFAEITVNPIIGLGWYDKISYNLYEDS